MSKFWSGLLTTLIFAGTASFIFTTLDNKYDIISWVKQKLRINNKFKAFLFFFISGLIINSIILRFVVYETLPYVAATSFFLGILIHFL